MLRDTPIALWATQGSPKFGLPVCEAITELAIEVAVSLVSLWETAIKHSLHRTGLGSMPISLTVAGSCFAAARYVILPIAAEHCTMREKLWLQNSDPFDRMSVAQAMKESLQLLTRDARISAYGSMISLV